MAEQLTSGDQAELAGVLNSIYKLHLSILTVENLEVRKVQCSSFKMRFFSKLVDIN